jgi:hypothetical protein
LPLTDVASFERGNIAFNCEGTPCPLLGPIINMAREEKIFDRDDDL